MEELELERPTVNHCSQDVDQLVQVLLFHQPQGNKMVPSEFEWLVVVLVRQDSGFSIYK